MDVSYISSILLLNHGLFGLLIIDEILKWVHQQLRQLHGRLAMRVPHVIFGKHELVSSHLEMYAHEDLASCRLQLLTVQQSNFRQFCLYCPGKLRGHLVARTDL